MFGSITSQTLREKEVVIEEAVSNQSHTPMAFKTLGAIESYLMARTVPVVLDLLHGFRHKIKSTLSAIELFQCEVRL